VVDEILGSAIWALGKNASIAFETLGSGKTILIVTHAMADVAKHCERAILIDHGSIIAMVFRKRSLQRIPI